PLTIGKTVSNAAEVLELLEPIRGHEMTKAALENALWDAEAKQKGVALSKLLGGTRTEIASGVSLGIRRDPEQLVEVIGQELADGYQRVKVKIKPGKDLAFIQAARKAYPELRLMADANSAYRLDDAPLLKQIDAFNLMMIEQPLQWD